MLNRNDTHRHITNELNERKCRKNSKKNSHIDRTNNGDERKKGKKANEKELFMVCILHNINYVIKLPSTSVPHSFHRTNCLVHRN